MVHAFKNINLFSNNERIASIRQEADMLIKTGGTKSSFFLEDPKSVEHRVQLWRTLLPRVEIF